MSIYNELIVIAIVIIKLCDRKNNAYRDCMRKQGANRPTLWYLFFEEGIKQRNKFTGNRRSGGKHSIGKE
jgi:hypothetical protein